VIRLDPTLHDRLASEEQAHADVLDLLQAEPLDLPALRMALLILSSAAERAAQVIGEVARG
jgi:hypothetical protein